MSDNKKPDKTASSSSILDNNAIVGGGLAILFIALLIASGFKLAFILTAAAGGGVFYVKSKSSPSQPVSKSAPPPSPKKETPAVLPQIRATAPPVLQTQEPVVAKEPEPKPEPKPEKPEKDSGYERRVRIMAECLETERSYCNHLREIKQYFLNPIREQGVLTEDEIRSSFGFIELIEDINRSVVLEKLEAWSPTCSLSPADVFEEIIDSSAYLKSYAAYINSFDALMAKRGKMLETNEKFAAFMASVDLSKIGNLTLDSLMIMPVQRLPRYELLLGELIKASPEGSDDRKTLERCREEIRKMTRNVNNSKADAEKRIRVVQVDGMLTGLKTPLYAESSRVFIKEGVLSQLPKAQGKPVFGEHQRRVYLFSDKIVFAKESRVDRSGRRSVSLEVGLDDLRVDFLKGTGDTPSTFIVTNRKVSAKEGIFALIAENEKETEDWFKEIQTAINTAKRKRLSFTQ